MSEIEIKQMQEKIDAGVRLAQERLVEKLKKADGELVVARNGKILKINPNTTVHNLPRPCKRCGQESIVNIEAPEPASSETSA